MPVHYSRNVGSTNVGNGWAVAPDDGLGLTDVAGAAITTGEVSTITHGSQLTTAMVGPWALQGAEKGSETLATAPVPAEGFWRSDHTGDWCPDQQSYVYNNDPANHGGVVPAGGLVIDGFHIPAGVFVAQFLDFSASGFSCAASTPMLFRGCRFRSAMTAPGYFNEHSNSAPIHVLHCDLGGLSAADSDYNEVPIDFSGSDNSIIARNYISLTTTGVQINADGCQVVENFITDLALYYGGNPPPGESTGKHLNGFTTNGGITDLLFLRNNVTLPSPDPAGRTIDQTDAFSMFQDFASFPGTGTNPDGSTGYQVRDNYLGGGGYTIYAGMNSGKAATTVQNLALIGNRISTQWWPDGGSYGPIAAEPAWGSYGNSQSDNLWADGPNAGTAAF